MLNTILYTSLAIIPFICLINFGDSIRYPKEVFSIFAFIAIIGVAAYSCTMRRFRNGWLFLFLAWCWFQTISNTVVVPVYLQKFILDMPAIMFAWKELFYVTLAIITIYCISSAEEDYEEKRTWFGKIIFNRFSVYTLAECITKTVLVTCIYAIIQAIGLDEIFRVADHGTGWIARNPLTGAADNIGSLSHRVVSTIGNPTLLGVWIAVCLPFTLFIKEKYGYITFALSCIVLALTSSGTAIATAIISTGLYLLFEYKKIFKYAITIAILSSLLIFIPQVRHIAVNLINPQGRVEVHKEAFNVLAEKPLTGMGLGTFEQLIGNNSEIYEKLHNQNWRELHDEIGQIWFSTGLIGLVIFMCFVGSLVRKAVTSDDMGAKVVFCSLVAFLFSSLFQFNFRVAPISLYGVILTGVYLKLVED